eukprot:1374419-Amphidinium_carterae.1
MAPAPAAMRSWGAYGDQWGGLLRLSNVSSKAFFFSSCCSCKAGPAIALDLQELFNCETARRED